MDGYADRDFDRGYGRGDEGRDFNGEVTLKGSVESREEKHLAEDTAESVLGVRDVHNHLTIARS